MAERKTYTPAQKQAIDKYMQKFDEYKLRLPAGRKDELKAHAAARGESLNSFITRAIDAQIDRDLIV